MDKELVHGYGLFAQLDITMEECGELIHACNQLKRAKGEGYKTKASETEAKYKLIKELAHVSNAIQSLQELLDIPNEWIESLIYESDRKARNDRFNDF